MKYRDYIASAVREADQRSSRLLATSSFLSDADWREALALVRSNGQELEWSAKSLKKIQHDSFAKAHLLDLIQECERLYEMVRLLSGQRAATAQDEPVHLKLAVRAPA